MTSSKRNSVFLLVLAAMFLALAMVLPFLTGQIPQVGSALCPMHIPVLLCGFFCGPWYGAAVGAVAPLLRFALFGMPPMPTSLAMCFELAVYGLVSGLLYRALPKKPVNLYVSLVAAMLAGRVMWGAVQIVLAGVRATEFTWAIFVAGAFTSAIPGIIIHIALIPVIVFAAEKASAKWARNA